MKKTRVGVAAAVCAWVLAVGAAAQTTMEAKPGKNPYGVDPAALHLAALIADPPARDSATGKAELAELHRIEATRTGGEVAAAKADEAEEDLFVYTTVLGPPFNAEALPLTAALGERVKNEQGVAGGALKAVFARQRPYQADKTLHPVCGVTAVPNSYPSGHALTGYMEALLLAEMVPEKKDEIFVRADEYAHHRLVCGVHYPSDVEASRRIAYAVFGYLLASPAFEADLAAARAETRAKLGMAK
jgi:acid phosphatase (class A)